MFYNIQNNRKDYIGLYRLLISLYVSIAEFANEYANSLARKTYMQIVIVLKHETLVSIHDKPVDQSIFKEGSKLAWSVFPETL